MKSPINTTERTICSPVSDINLAALLLALGFELLDRSAVQQHDLSSSRHAGGTLGSWTFSAVGQGGRRFDSVCRAWRDALKDTPGCPADVRAAKLAAHNLRTLTAAATRGESLAAYELEDATRLTNDPAAGAAAVPRVAAPLPPAVSLRSTAPAAAALACGCRITGYIPTAEGTLWCLAPGPRAEHTPAQVEHLWRDLTWVSTPGNMHPLAVALATLVNRRELLADSHAPRTMHLVRSGDSVLYLPANAPQSMVDAGSRLLNI